MTSKVVMVDAGGSNLGSVQAALARLGVDALITGNWALIRNATHVILPGVGAARPAMQRLQQHGLVDKIGTLTQPVLGVCVGMQVMFERSQEGGVTCLGIFPGEISIMAPAEQVRVPHMGWNILQHVRSCAISSGLGGEYAYFVHSFAAKVAPACAMRFSHGQDYAALVQRDNFFGAQFHPERSARAGSKLLQNFLSLS
jgi:imidazole glycerol-phosphate synthase subunit HisH